MPPIDGDGRIALQDGRYREALEIFDALLASQPENASGHHGRGLALSALADDRGALEAFEKAVALARTAVAARYDYARSLEALDELEPALDAYRAVLELNPHHRGARYRLGTLLLRAGRWRMPSVSCEAMSRSGSGIIKCVCSRPCSHPIGLLPRTVNKRRSLC